MGRAMLRNKLRKLFLIQTGLLLWILYEISPHIFEEDEDTLLRVSIIIMWFRNFRRSSLALKSQSVVATAADLKF